MLRIINFVGVVKIIHDLPEEDKDVSKHVGVAKDRTFMYVCKLWEHEEPVKSFHIFNLTFNWRFHSRL